MEKIGIVLSGGGAKGAYQIGAWKALRKLKIKYDIVTGTSVGALNGIFLTQKNYYRCLFYWLKVDYNTIFKKGSFNKKENLYLNYLQSFIKDGGMNPSGLANLLDKTYSKRKFFKSKINYGLITYNLTSFKPVAITKDNIPKDKVKDYALASATCFPAFKLKNIDGNKYLDGGYYDNMPINLAIEMGATKIIAIDLKAIGIKRKVKNSDIKITYISPTSKLYSILEFDKKKIKYAMNLGYLDTLKVLGDFEGTKYTFKPNELTNNYLKFNGDFKSIISNHVNLNNKPLISLLTNINGLKSYLKNLDTPKSINNTIEYLGKIFKLNIMKIYSIKKFNQLLIKEFNKIESINTKSIEVSIKNDKLDNLLQNSSIIKFVYDAMINNKKINYNKIAHIFPNDYFGAIYLYLIKKDIS